MIPEHLVYVAFFLDNYHPITYNLVMTKLAINQKGNTIWYILVALVLIVAAVVFFSTHVSSNKNNNPKAVLTTKTTSTVTKTPNPCQGNNLSQLVIVSISLRHMWACDLSSDEYNSPVITGMDFLAADLTPTGTYHIYAKETDVYLKGSDSTGSWDDYVYYWMPFLDNQYGAYGFHDATWRAANAFGNISPNSNQASHGCVEMPLAAAKWLYNWSVIGTTVTIEA